MTSRDPDSGSKVPGLWTGAGLGDRIRPMCCQLTLFDERRGRSRPTSSQHPEQQQLPGCGSWDVATQTETERVPVATQTEPAATQNEPEAAAAPPEAPTRVSPPRWRPKERRRGVQAASRRAERRYELAPSHSAVSASSSWLESPLAYSSPLVSDLCSLHNQQNKRTHRLTPRVTRTDHSLDKQLLII